MLLGFGNFVSLLLDVQNCIVRLPLPKLNCTPMYFLGTCYVQVIGQCIMAIFKDAQVKCSFEIGTRFLKSVEK